MKFFARIILAVFGLLMAACGSVATPVWSELAQGTQAALAATADHLTEIAPTATAGTNVDATSFTANWGAVSGATILKAKVKYGTRIAALKSAVAAGDFAAVAAEKSAFIVSAIPRG